MKTPFTITDCIIFAILGSISGVDLAYILHGDAQDQAKSVREYMESEQYRVDRAAHMKRMEGLR